MTLALLSPLLHIVEIFHNKIIFKSIPGKTKKKRYTEKLSFEIMLVFKVSLIFSQLGKWEYPNPPPDHRPPKNVTLKNMYVTRNNSKGKQSNVHYIIG